MSPPLFVTLFHLNQAAKEIQTGPIFCCWCNNCINFIKYGKYQRFGFSDDELIDIQRFLCKNDSCRRTFSVLPHPFLRITRFTLCIFRTLQAWIKQTVLIAEIARRMGSTWPTMARAIEKAHCILDWIEQEVRTEPLWAPSPCIDPPRYWSEFNRVFAAKFYPIRYGAAPPTEYENLQ